MGRIKGLYNHIYRPQGVESWSTGHKLLVAVARVMVPVLSLAAFAGAIFALIALLGEESFPWVWGTVLILAILGFCVWVAYERLDDE